MTTQIDSPRRALKTPQAAQYLGISVSLLRKMRQRGPQDRQPGPAFVKLSKQLVVYEIASLDTWLDKQRAISDSTVTV